MSVLATMTPPPQLHTHTPLHHHPLRQQVARFIAALVAAPVWTNSGIQGTVWVSWAFQIIGTQTLRLGRRRIRRRRRRRGRGAFRLRPAPLPTALALPLACFPPAHTTHPPPHSTVLRASPTSPGAVCAVALHRSVGRGVATSRVQPSHLPSSQEAAPDDVVEGTWELLGKDVHGGDAPGPGSGFWQSPHAGPGAPPPTSAVGDGPTAGASDRLGAHAGDGGSAGVGAGAGGGSGGAGVGLAGKLASAGPDVGSGAAFSSPGPHGATGAVGGDGALHGAHGGEGAGGHVDGVSTGPLAGVGCATEGATAGAAPAVDTNQDVAAPSSAGVV
jgi:hypothetical protein